MLHLTMSLLYPSPSRSCYQKAQLEKLGDGQLGDGDGDPGDGPIMEFQGVCVSAHGPQDLFKSHRHPDALLNSSRDHFSPQKEKTSPHTALSPAL